MKKNDNRNRKGVATSKGNRRHVAGVSDKAIELGLSEINRAHREWYRRRYNMPPPSVSNTTIGMFELYPSGCMVK